MVIYAVKESGKVSASDEFGEGSLSARLGISCHVPGGADE